LLASDRRPVLVDFGVAAEISDESALSVCCGTPGYMAPEVITRCVRTEQAEKVDLFSVGSLLHFLLSGRIPSSGNGFQKKAIKTRLSNVSFDACLVSHDVSHVCKSLIILLLKKDPNARPNATRALEHPWFQAAHCEHAETQAEIRVNRAAARTAPMSAAEPLDTKVAEHNASSSRTNVDAQQPGAPGRVDLASRPSARRASAAAEAAAVASSLSKALAVAHAPGHGMPPMRTQVQQFEATAESVDMAVNHRKGARLANVEPWKMIDPMTMLGVVP